MMRCFLGSVALMTVASVASAELPIIPPAAPATTLPGTVIAAPQAYPSCNLPMAPSVPPPTDCNPTCGVAKSPGFFRTLMERICGTRTAGCTRPSCTTCTTPAPTACATPCPTPCGTPLIRGYWHPVVNPVAVAKPVVKAAECAPCATAAAPKGVITKVTCASPDTLDRIKNWFCWKPCQQQYLPTFTPVKYHAPLRAYAPLASEPTSGIPCGPRVKAAPCATKTCATTACPTNACPTNGCATAVAPATTGGCANGGCAPSIFAYQTNPGTPQARGWNVWPQSAVTAATAAATPPAKATKTAKSQTTQTTGETLVPVSHTEHASNSKVTTKPFSKP